MAFSKAIRQAVYAKHNGRCAYCGSEIAYKDMQVDHFIPKGGYFESGTDDLENLVPSCRMCNHYKRANTLETFRRYIQEIPRKLRENYIYKVGVVYGNVIENKKPIVFFFEQNGNEAKPQNNADRIRAMSDEELAELLFGFECAKEKFGTQWDCQGEALQWLREPVDLDDEEDEEDEEDEDKRLPRLGRWVFWDGWVSNHDLRIDDVFCSACGYRHPSVRWEEGDPTGAEAAAAVLGKLAKQCPRCGAKMIGGGDGEK